MQQDKIVIETTRTHRSRLASALAFGPLGRRRPVNSNLRRLLGSVVLAAVVCVGCLGFSFVVNLLTTQREDAAVASFQQARSTNPIPPSDTLVEDEETGFLRDTETGELIDPRTGFVVDPDTLLATAPDGRTVDPRTGWYLDPSTGYYTDPESGITIDPDTLQVVDEEDS
jgi:hypothetical protein